MLGENIRKFRTDKKLSYRALAAKSGVSTTTICSLEKQIMTNPTVDTIEKIARALGTNSDVLLGSFNGLVNLINYARNGRNIEQYSQSTGISVDYLDKLCKGDIPKPPSPDVLRKIADDPDAPEEVSVDYYIDLMEFAGHYDHETAKEMRTPINCSKFDKLIDIEKLKRHVEFLDLNPTLMAYFESSDFTDEEIDKILDYMEFVLSQRKKK